MYQYKLEEDNSPLFSFVTKHNLHYFVSFKKMDFENSYFSNLFSLDFWEMENQKFIKDEFIGETIIYIVFEFFKKFPNSLLHYVCDSVDNRQNGRSKLFDKWYNKSENINFSKLNIEFKIERELNYNLEFIFKSEYYDFEITKETIIMQLQEFSNYK